MSLHQQIRFVVGAALIVVIQVYPAFAEAVDSRPNVVWILLDACRAANLSCYGYARQTSPHIDRLAADGAVFEWHFSQYPYTARSVPSYLSSRYFPVPIFFSDNWRDTWKQRPADELFAPEIFRGNGYRTAMVTAHTRFSPRGYLWPQFDEAVFLPPDPKRPAPHLAYTPARYIIDTAMEMTSRKGDAPIFLYIHLMDTHFPHVPGPHHAPWLSEAPPDPSRLHDPALPASSYDNPAKSIFDDALAGGNAPAPERRFSPEDQAYLQGLYDGSIAEADAEVGRLVGFFKDRGLYENTIFLITSDHGEVLGENGISVQHYPWYNTDDVFRVPFVITGPGVPRGLRISESSQNVDILPTLVDLLNLETRGAFDGLSLRPQFSESTRGRLRGLDFMVAGWPRKPKGMQFILRDSAFKYMRDHTTGQEYAWPVPDLLGARTLIASPDAEAVAKRRGLVTREYMPRYEALMALPPVSARPVFCPLSPGSVDKDFRSACVRDDVPDDGLWTTAPKNVAPQYLRSFPGEDAPPIEYRFRTPSERFKVYLHCSPQPGGAPVAFQVKVDDEAHFRTVATDEGTNLIALGEYAIKDWLRLQFDDVPGRPAQAESLVLIPAALEVEAHEEAGAMDALQEQLRALGYTE